jgi:hypothetical protein
MILHVFNTIICHQSQATHIRTPHSQMQWRPCKEVTKPALFNICQACWYTDPFSYLSYKITLHVRICVIIAPRTTSPSNSRLCLEIVRFVVQRLGACTYRKARLHFQMILLCDYHMLIALILARLSELLWFSFWNNLHWCMTVIYMSP